MNDAASSQNSFREADRLEALLNTLSIERAYFVTDAGPQLNEVRALSSLRVESLVVAGVMGQPEHFRHLTNRVTIVDTDLPPKGSRLDGAVAAIPGAECVVLSGYEWFLWSDVVADRPNEFLEAILNRKKQGQKDDHPDSGSLRTGFEEAPGVIAGLRYRITGHGPPLVLMPVALAPSQWTPILERLEVHFTVVQLSGSHVGIAAILEARAASSGHREILESFIKRLKIQPGDSVLEVGCGTAAVARLIAHLTQAAKIVATDINPYLMQEAQSLVDSEGLASRVEIVCGDAEKLPFPDDSFAVSVSITTFEECHVDVALAELLRVTVPGGRIGVIVRATDVPKIVNLDASVELKQELARQTGVGYSSGGCADLSLYSRMAALGLQRLKMFPQLAVADSSNGLWLETARQSTVVQLSPSLQDEYLRAEAAARDRGTFFIAGTLHCCVGVKPPSQVPSR
jgi:SAM-dependent methyltransferase